MKKKVLYILGTIAMLLASCTNENYMTYDPADNGVYFNHDTLIYSFSVTPIETTTHTLNVPVKIMGTVSKEARAFSYAIETEMPSAKVLEKIYVPKSKEYVWAKEGVEYTLPKEVTIPADAIEGIIPITINRAALKGDYANGYKRYRIVLRLKPNANFAPTLSEADQVRIVEFDNAIDQPAWYDAYGEKVWLEGELGKWHPLKFIKMVEYFHAIADILPETYKDMVALYGENLEYIPYGSPYQYRTIFRKYIYQPLYEYIEAHHDEIAEAYPDFPFDFPNPFH